MIERILEVRNLKTYYFTSMGTVKAVDGVTFSIGKGETMGLVGESGCGKSTVGISIMRLVDYPGKIVNGEIIFEGENLLEKTEEDMTEIRGKKIGMILQDPMTALNPVYAVGEQTQEGLIAHRILPKGQAKKRSLELFKEVGIPSPEERIDQYPHHFSGGMRQRIVIAIGLSCSPTLLIADEPTTNLDATVQAQILNLMKTLKERFNSSLLLITHHLGQVAEMCDRVAVMYAGDLVEFCDAMSLFYQTKHPYTLGLLNCIPTRRHGKSKKLFTIEGSVPNLINPPPGCKFHPRCPKAMAICSEQKPELIEVEPKHYVACHLY